MRFSDIKFSEEGAAGRLNQIYDWVRNLTGYFLFMAVLENLLPGKKYARFVKFFAGIVLILLGSAAFGRKQAVGGGGCPLLRGLCVSGSGR